MNPMSVCSERPIEPPDWGSGRVWAGLVAGPSPGADAPACGDGDGFAGFRNDPAWPGASRRRASFRLANREGVSARK